MMGVKSRNTFEMNVAIKQKGVKVHLKTRCETYKKLNLKCRQKNKAVGNNVIAWKPPAAILIFLCFSSFIDSEGVSIAYALGS